VQDVDLGLEAEKSFLFGTVTGVVDLKNLYSYLLLGIQISCQLDSASRINEEN